MNSFTKQQCEWPDPALPGVPLNPTVPGAHWLRGYTEDAWMYDGDGGWWGPGYSHKLDAETVAAGYAYLGPVLSHDEAAALQKRVAELEGVPRDLMLPQTPASFAGSMRRAREKLAQSFRTDEPFS